MTCFVVINLARRFQINIKETDIAVSKNAASLGGTSAGLRTNEQITIENLLYGLMLPSGNDAAQVLAEYFGRYLYLLKQNKLFPGSQKTILQKKDYSPCFISEMNRTARQLELKYTAFANAHGLMNKFNVSSAHDICKLSALGFQIPLFAEIIKTKSYSCKIKLNANGNQFRECLWINTNKLLENGCNGVKTGITDQAGPCLCASYQSDNVHIILAMLNTKNRNSRFTESFKLLKWILEFYGIKELFNNK